MVTLPSPRAVLSSVRNRSVRARSNVDVAPYTQNTCCESMAKDVKLWLNLLGSTISIVRSRACSKMLISELANSVTHYAEGSLMPILLTKVMCRRIPERAPLLLKPLLWSVFEAVSCRMVAPRLEIHRDQVGASPGRPKTTVQGLMTVRSQDRDETRRERRRVPGWR